MIRPIGIASVGDSSDVSAFSGIPYHFLNAAQNAKWNVHGWKIDLHKINKYRIAWNIAQILQLRKRGGYQYTLDFSSRLLNQVPREYLQQTIISFNQFFPPADALIKQGGKLYYYIDATFTQLIDRYGIGKIIGNKIKQEALKREKEYFEKAEHIVTFQNWAKDSILNDYGIAEDRVSVILPGANINLTSTYNPTTKNERLIGKETPFILGFIGKDWKRKGLPLLVNIRDELERRGWNIIIRCAGYAPDEFKRRKGIEFVGFIDKRSKLDDFCNFVQSCHIGCLFSEAEFSSIAVLEFIRLGVPVAGFIVDGMGDLFFPDVSLRFTPNNSIGSIVDEFEKLLLDPNLLKSKTLAAQKKSSYVTWDRCIQDWDCLLKKHSK